MQDSTDRPTDTHQADVPQLGDRFLSAATAEPIMKFFKYEQLPPVLQAVSAPFGELALRIFENTPRSAERAAGLRKLLEAKDCIVRASL